MDKLHIVTVSTDSQYYFPYLVESCKRNGKELEILGMGEKWQGFNWRYVKMIEYLKNLPTDDIVCFVDGYDVICCRDLNEMVDEFLKIKEHTGCKMIVGHDKIHSLNMNEIYFGKCKNQSLNAGTYIGYVCDVLEIIQKIYELNPKNDADDQVLMTQYCKKTDNEILCDTENKLFLTLVYSLQELDNLIDIDENTKKLSYESNEPFFVHAPGYGYLDNVIKKLGYPIEENKIKNELFWNVFEKKILMYFKIIILKYYLIFLLIFVIIIYIIYFKKINKYLIKISKKS